MNVCIARAVWQGERFRLMDSAKERKRERERERERELRWTTKKERNQHK